MTAVERARAAIDADGDVPVEECAALQAEIRARLDEAIPAALG